MPQTNVPYDYQIVKLDPHFFTNYPQSQYPELMHKDARPYTCLLFQTHYDYFVCVPFRSFIRHPNAFMFKGTKRSIDKLSGIDYTKMVIIYNKYYISDEPAVIDKDEYNETISHINKIQSDALKYLDKYIEHIKEHTETSPDYRRNFQYTALKYFHSELGI